MKPYPIALMTKEAREKNRLSNLASYKSGKRKPVFKGEKRPEHSKIMKELYKSGKKKPIMMFNENNPAWKGDQAGYYAIHRWLYNRLGKAWKCLACNKLNAKKYEWASLSHKPKRDLTDWTMLCTSCHRLYDYGKLEVPTWTPPV